MSARDQESAEDDSISPHDEQVYPVVVFFTRHDILTTESFPCSIVKVKTYKIENKC